MSAHAPVRTEAIVLRRTNYGEADRIVQFLTPNGKVSALTRGVRREKSKLAGGIELLAVTDITLQSGRGELSVVTSARLKQFFSHILDDYDRLQFMYYVLKDVGKVSEQVQEPDFFIVVQTVLQSLDEITVPLGATELWYRLQMAQLLGVGANLTRDAAGRKLMPGEMYRFDSTDMAFVQHQAGEYGSDHIKLLRLAASSPPVIIAHVSRLDELLARCLAVARAVHE